VPGSPSIRVVLCDDHTLVREGLERVFDGDDRIVVVASTPDGEAGVEAALRLDPDVVLMDLVMPRLDGVGATRRILARRPGAKVLVLTSFADESRVLDAVDAGACGYVLKDASAKELVRAIVAAAAGETPLDPRVAGAVVARQIAGDRRRVLSDRELEVLGLVADGLSSKVIARRLGITVTTVRKHLTHIYRAIGVADRTQAALWAIQHGFGGGA
jgi:DNA-binding NarL/FixJ family response regulator